MRELGFRRRFIRLRTAHEDLIFTRLYRTNTLRIHFGKLASVEHELHMLCLARLEMNALKPFKLTKRRKSAVAVARRQQVKFSHFVARSLAGVRHFGIDRERRT